MTSPSRAFAFRRWAVIVAAAFSWVLVMVSMLVDPAPEADGRELIAAYASDTFASGLHTNLIHYGFALMAPVAFALVGLVRERGAWLANVAAMLAFLGLSTLPGIVLLDLLTTATVQVTDVDTAVAASDRLAEAPAFIAILAVAVPSALLAIPVAVAALWRAGLVHGIVPILAIVAAIAPNTGLPWWLGFGTHAAFMMLLAYLLWRLPASVWQVGSARAVAPGPGHRVEANSAELGRV